MPGCERCTHVIPCEVALLDKIAEYFNVPITEFFDKEIAPTISDIYGNITTNNNSQINAGDTTNRLVSLLDEKDKQVKQLLQIIAQE